MKMSTRAFFTVSLLALLSASILHILLLWGVNIVWTALIHLTLFGWISCMIFAVNYHTMPVFSARDFPKPYLIWVHFALFGIGVSLATWGRLAGWNDLVGVGIVCELFGALVFVANLVLLFTHGPRRAVRPPIPPIPNQAAVDHIGTLATQVAGVCLPFALVLMALTTSGWLQSSWWLVAEHGTVLGWMLLMIVGVAYHVLPRFSGQSIRGTTWARVQLFSHLIALLLITVALGFGWSEIFMIGALLMSASIAGFAWTIWPTLQTVARYGLPVERSQVHNTSLQNHTIPLKERTP